MPICIKKPVRLFVAALLLGAPLALGAAESFELTLQKGGQQLPVATVEAVAALREGDKLFDGASVETDQQFIVSAVRRSSLGNIVVSGFNEAGGRLLLVVSDAGGLEGFLHDVEGRRRITGEIGQAALIERSEAQKPLPAEAIKILPKRPDRGRVQVDADRPSVEAYRRRAAPLAAAQSQGVRYPAHLMGKATIDVLIYYDDDMTEDPSVIADLMVEVTNQAMLNSDIEIELRVAGLKGKNISNQTTQSDLLSDMFYRESPFTQIEEDRAELNADLVIAIRDERPTDDSSCGIAYIGVQEGFPWRRLYVSSVLWDPLESGGGNFCTDTTFAHEVGHILGSMHERRLYEDGDAGAYEFSFGHYRTGLQGWHTIMSYGKEPEYLYFSSPDIRQCRSQPCGIPPGQSDSADNSSGFTNTRHMVAGYYSEQLTHELIVHHRHEGGCTVPGGQSGVFRGHSVMNETQYAVEVRSFSVMTDQGEVLSETYAAGEEVLMIGEEREFGFDRCTPEDEIHPYGNTYVASWVTYADPKSGHLYESIHIPWEEDYQGEYARITIATGAGGQVEGHTGLFVKVGESKQIRFVPDKGYRVSDIKGSCKGDLEGTDFSIDAVIHDCTIEAYFEVDPDGGGDGGDGGDGGGNVTPEPPGEAPEGSEGMFSALLDAVFKQINPMPTKAGALRSDAPPPASEVVSATEEPPRPIPAASYLALVSTAMIMLLTGWLRLRRDQVRT